MNVLMLVIGVGLILVAIFNLEKVVDRPLTRIIMVICGVTLIVLVATSCDPASDCDLEKNYGTAHGEATACS